MADKMLACGACLRRTLQIIPRRRLALESITSLQARRPLRQTTRSFSSTTHYLQQTSQPLSPSLLPSGTDLKFGGLSKDEEQRLERKVMKELDYLRDPYKIAEWVSQRLEKGQYHEALALTRKASKDYSVVVAWNHLVGYLLRHNHITRAMKLYNEMKKRAQEPNARTYTVIFRELGKSQHPKLAMAEAMKLYNKLLADERITPNSFHLNAVLNVCNRAGDLDSMFSVVATVDDAHRSPTVFTYTTVLNALRYNINDGVKNLPRKQQEINCKTAVQRGKAIWEEAMQRRQKGLLQMDEALVCAMCRLLLMLPKNSGRGEVLEIIEQTMGIPDLLKADDSSAPDPSGQGSGSKQVAPSAPKVPMVSPGTNTLAVILKVVTEGNKSTFGIKYWNLLVREYKVVPDRDCWFRLFGLLKQAKASAYAVDLLAIVPDEYVSVRLYRMVMEACIRDNINPNAIKNSTRALESMMKRLPVPDPHAMRLYLRVAQAHHFHLRSRSDDGDVEGAKREYGLQIAQALDNLWGPYRMLHSHYFKELKPKTDAEKGILYNDQREVIALARIMYGSYNKILQQEMLPEADLERVRPIGGRINREIQAFFANREEIEPNLRKTKGRGTAEQDMSPYEDATETRLLWDTTLAGKPRPAREPVRKRGGRNRAPEHDNSGQRGREGRCSRGSTFENRERSLPPGDPLSRRAPVEW
ncbi:hypothetical protein ACHAPT_003078 [Fusarium lateritium]